MKYELSNFLAVRKIEGEVFVYNREKSAVHTFNRTGTFLWEQINAGVPADQLSGRLAGRFDVDANTAERDTTDFLDMLERNGLIRIQEQ